eukprot:1540842-Amphidinium_carterae.1
MGIWKYALEGVGFTLMQSMDKPPVKPVPAAIVETTIDSLYGLFLTVPCPYSNRTFYKYDVEYPVIAVE